MPAVERLTLQLSITVNQQSNAQRYNCHLFCLVQHLVTNYAPVGQGSNETHGAQTARQTLTRKDHAHVRRSAGA